MMDIIWTIAAGVFISFATYLLGSGKLYKMVYRRYKDRG